MNRLERLFYWLSQVISCYMDRICALDNPNDLGYRILWNRIHFL